MTSQSVYTLIGLAVTVLTIVVLLVASRRKDPARAIEAAERWFSDGRFAQARAGFERANVLLDAGKGNSADRQRLLGQTCARLGEIDESEGREREAVRNYKRAQTLGARVPDSAARLLAEVYAAENATDDSAIEAYLEYLKERAWAGARAERVFAALQTACRVSEETRPASRKAAAALLRRVIAVRPELEWASYYLGFCEFLDGRARQSLAAFQSARKLNPARTITLYWLCVCHLQQTPAQLQEAMTAIETLLQHPHEEGKYRKRVGKACFEIALGIVRSIGGLEGDRYQAQEERRTIRLPRLPLLQRAIRFLDIAAERLPDDARLHYLLGCALEHADGGDRIVAALTKAATLAPGEKEYAYRLGVARDRAGDLAGAVAALKRAIEIDPGYQPALSLRAVLAIRNGDHAAAEPAVRAALRGNAGNPELSLLLLQSLFGQNKYPDLIREVDSTPSIRTAAESNPEGIFVVARSLAFSGVFEKAIQWLGRLRHEARGQYHLGCAYANAGRLEEALPCFEGLIGKDGEYRVPSIVQRGHVCLAQGLFAEAERDYRDVLEHHGGGPDVRYALGMLYLRKGDSESAVELLAEAVSDAPDNGRAQYGLGVAYEKGGDFEEALKCYLAATRDAGLQGSARLRAGVLQCRLGHFAAALKTFQPFSDDQSGSIERTLLFYRGTALAHSGRLPEAIRDWAQLHAGNPENEGLALNLARAYYMAGSQEIERGEIGQALLSWTEYRKLNPRDEEIGKDLAELSFRLATTEIARTEGADIEKARALFSAAILHDPTNSTWSYYSALCSLRSGHYDECLQNLRKLITTEGRQPRILYHCVLCMLALGDRDGAQSAFAELQSETPGDRYTRYCGWALANEHLRLGQTTEALEILSSVQPALQAAA